MPEPMSAERVWVVEAKHDGRPCGVYFAVTSFASPDHVNHDPQGIEYVRADLYAALLAEREELREALAEVPHLRAYVDTYTCPEEYDAAERRIDAALRGEEGDAPNPGTNVPTEGTT